MILKTVKQAKIIEIKKNVSVQLTLLLAQRKGFEPLDTFLHHTISNRARSTAPPSLQANLL